MAIATMNGRKDSIRGELEVDGVSLASLRANIKTTYQMQHVAQDAHMTWCVQREGIDGGDENTSNTKNKYEYARARSGDKCSGTWCLLGLGKRPRGVLDAHVVAARATKRSRRYIQTQANV